jgi:hypothetical protein
MNTQLIAEYLTMCHFQPPNPTSSYFQKQNQLALQIAMEVPTDVWIAIVETMKPGKTYSSVWELVDIIRGYTNPNDVIRNKEDAVIHKLTSTATVERKN